MINNYEKFIDHPKEEIINDWDDLTYRYGDASKKMVVIEIN